MKNAPLIIFSVIAGLVVLGFLLFSGVVPGVREGPIQKTTIEFWTPEDDADAWDAVLEAYEGSGSNISVNVVQKNPATYHAELLDALAAGRGPDVFFLYDQDTLRFSDKITPLPQSTFGFGPLELRNNFTDFAAEVLVQGVDQKIVGLPLWLDTLALFYNRDIFNSANIPAPPATWDEFSDVAPRLTQISTTRSIIRGGAAIGGSLNVERAVDILSALMLQSGAKIVDAETLETDLGESISLDGARMNPSEQALNFYTSFAMPAKRTYSWAQTMPNAFDAFASSRVAMAFGYSNDIPRIRVRNPNINMSVAPLPQTSVEAVRANYGTLGFLSVSRISKDASAAWHFILFATSREGASLHLQFSGKPPARRDLVTVRAPTTDLQVFYNQSLSARGWLKPDAARVTSIFNEMIENVLVGKFQPSASAEQAGGRLQQLLPKR
ncbi:MAG: extracellular solute-binding protein [bacterium]|nr:extracellular solute-binding protein [bacterium]